MQAEKILEQYAQIEYLSTTDDKWYKLMDYYPFAFPLENEDSIVVLDMGRDQGSDFGHFKIQDDELWRQEFESHEWYKVTDIRICREQGIKYSPPKMTAKGTPFRVTKVPRDEALWELGNDIGVTSRRLQSGGGASMKQAETTVVKISSDIFDDKALLIEGHCEATVKVTYPAKHNTPMPVTMSRQGEEPETKMLMPGDTCAVSHKFKAEFIKDLSQSNAFPITFTMDGQEYKLNRTKQNKLILTK